MDGKARRDTSGMVTATQEHLQLQHLGHHVLFCYFCSFHALTPLALDYDTTGTSAISTL